MCKNNCIIIERLWLPYVNQCVSLEFIRGVNYLQGANGAGKTILLDYIAGLRKDKHKKIKGNNNVIYINQSIFFSDRLRGEDFFEFVYRLEDIKKDKCNIYKNFVVEQALFEGKNLLEKQWGMLSGGERRYLYTIILLSLEKDWYILDEPFAFVDEEKKKRLWKLIEEKADAGKGIILTSHEKDVISKRRDINFIQML